MSGACCETTGATTLEEVRVASVPAITRIHVALAGQPNVGKSTIFNVLTGLNQHVGNWPGKTVEQKIGSYTHDDVTLDIVDLPGTYSLTANSPEELIAREYILTQHPDVIVAIVDAAILERSLYLVAELVQLGMPLVVGLNMIDVAQQNGMQIDLAQFSQAIGVPVIDLIAAKNVGIDRLVTATIQAACEANLPIDLPALPVQLESAQAEVEQIIAAKLPEVYPLHWAALKVLEHDAALIDQLRNVLSLSEHDAFDRVLLAYPDAPIMIAGERYTWISRAVKTSVTRRTTAAASLTARLDRVATHPVWGLGVLAGIIGVLFMLTYSIGQPLQAWLDVTVVHNLARIASTLLANAPAWLQSLVVEGVIGGVGLVMTFIPILVIFFAGMAVLGRRGLHVARGLFDGRLHARDGPARQIVFALISRLWLQCAVGGGHARDRSTQSAVVDDRAAAAGALYGAIGRSRLHDARLLRRGRAAGGVGIGRAESHFAGRGGRGVESHAAKKRAQRLHHGTAVVSSTEWAHHRRVGVAAHARVCEARRIADPGDDDRDLGAG